MYDVIVVGAGNAPFAAAVSAVENGAKRVVVACRDDLMRVTDGRSGPDLANILIDRSHDTMCWMQGKGPIKFELALSVMGIRVGGTIKWPKDLDGI